MNSFVQQHAGSVIGTLSGFDRILFRGTLTRLCNGGGLFDLMRKAGYLLKDFGNFCGKVTGEVVAASEQSAKEAGRPKVHLFNPSVRKEEVAKEIARRDGIESGLVCLLTAVEPCWTFAFNPNGRNKGRETKVLTACRRKCLHHYHCMIHPEFGLMHARPGLLDGIARQINPAYPAVPGEHAPDYYWSVDQSEWATDVMFKNPAALAALYPRLIRHGITTLASPDVLRFLGHKIPSHGHASGTAQRQTGARAASV